MPTLTERAMAARQKMQAAEPHKRFLPLKEKAAAAIELLSLPNPWRMESFNRSRQAEILRDFPQIVPALKSEAEQHNTQAGPDVRAAAEARQAAHRCAVKRFLRAI